MSVVTAVHLYVTDLDRSVDFYSRLLGSGPAAAYWHGLLERSREMMERQVQHMTRMVDDLLDVSRVTLGKIQISRELVNLAPLVTRTVVATSWSKSLAIPGERYLLDRAQIEIDRAEVTTGREGVVSVVMNPPPPRRRCPPRRSRRQHPCDRPRSCRRRIATARRRQRECLSTDAVARAGQVASERRFKAIPLKVSAPFHCALMQPAADVMREALAKVEIKTPQVPLVANVLASPVSDPEQIRTRLIEQVTGMVRWRETMLYLKTNGVGTVYEIGAGRVLTGIARRFDGIEAKSVGTPEELETAAAALAG